MRSGSLEPWRAARRPLSAAFGLLAAAAAMAAPCPAPDHLTHVSGGDECLLVRTEGHGASPATLFVLLHGNHTSGSPAVSMYRPAAVLATQGPPGTIAVALIRPGYDNDAGEHSSGDAAGRADNFTAANIDIVADAIARLKDFHQAAHVVLIGHSGGAAMAGVILGRHPGLADAAVLAACPCDLAAWRGQRGNLLHPWRSESAIAYVERIPAATRVAIVVGSKDTVTPPALSVAYADALRARGIATELSALDGLDHVTVIDAPATVDAALRLAPRP